MIYLLDKCDTSVLLCQSLLTFVQLLEWQIIMIISDAIVC